MEIGNIIQKIICINRVAKVVAGGKRLRFNSMVVVGNGRGQVGAGMGKAKDVAMAISKAVMNARKNMFEVYLKDNGRTILFPTIGRSSGCWVLLKPASKGRGINASWAARAVVEALGVKDIYIKSLRKSNNPINVVWAVIDGLKRLNQLVESYSLRTGREIKVG